MKKMLLLVFVFACIVNVYAQPGKTAIVLLKHYNADSASHIKQLIADGEIFGKQDTALALQLLWQAVKKANSVHNIYLEGKAYNAIGDLYFAKALYNRSFINFTRAGRLFMEINSNPEIAYASLGIAKSQYYRGTYTKAATNFVEAIRRGETYNLPGIRDEANEYLGLIYSAFQSLQKNINSYLQSFMVKLEMHDDKGIVRVAAGLSEIYYKERKFDSALHFSEISLLAAKRAGMATDGYMARIRKTFSLINLKKTGAAEKELLFFEQNKPSPQDANLQIRYQTLLGSYYAAKKEERISRLHYDSALATVNNNAFPELLLIVYEEMATAYYEMGEVQKAYDSYKKYNRQLSIFYTGNNLTTLANLEGLVMLEASKDEITNLHNENQFKALALLHEKDLRQKLVFENELKDSLLLKETLLREALTRENKYREEKLSAQQKLSYSVNSKFILQKEKMAGEQWLRSVLIAGVTLLSVLVTLILFLYYKQKKKSVIIGRQADDLQTLMKEIHHRVKNNLQIISSLLDLQSISIQDKEASEAVKESKNRVLSMALIHQNLYSEGNIKGIKVREYIQTLAGNLFDSYNIQKEKIKLITDIDPLNLDVDTVIPIGLIINELVSNSLKYAFSERDSGEIKITLKQNLKELHLQIKDNGNGFASDWMNSNTSFGYKLIKAFTQKLKARLEVYNDNGACVCMTILKYKLAG